MTPRLLLVPLAAIALCGCVSVPTSPTIPVMPGPQKSFDQFQSDNAGCQQYAHSLLAPAGEAAANNAAANAAVGTALGAAAGAIIGSVSGQAGAGAAIGAGTGLLFGSAAGGNVANASNFQLQQRYNVAYAQCMFAHGNQVPGQVVARRQPVYSYPPPNFPPPGPSQQSLPPPNYGGPSAPPNYGVPGAPQGYPPGNYPPPNTPPPTGPQG